MNIRFLFAIELLLFACLLQGGCFHSTDSNAIDSHSLRIVEPRIDLGSFLATDNVQARITVQNSGQINYNLKSLTLSCGCLASDFTPRSMEPSQSYTFSVRLLTTSLGVGRQTGEIETEPPTLEPVRFELMYKVEPSSSLFPKTFLMGMKARNQEWPQMVEFEIQDLAEEITLSGPIRLERRYDHSKSIMDYTAVQVDSLRSGEAIRIEVRPGNDIGNFHDYFRLIVPGPSGDLEFAVGITGALIESIEEQEDSLGVGKEGLR